MKKRFNNLQMLEQWGWINSSEFLWWNFNYPKEERRFIQNIEDFMSNFEEVGEIKGQKLYVTSTNYIPITALPLKIDKYVVNMMVTARPVSTIEFQQYFDRDLSEVISSTSVPDLDGNYRDKKGHILKSKLLVEELKRNVKKGSKEIADHFFPHIRGVIREVNDEAIFYHELYNMFWGNKPNRDELITKALIKQGFDFIDKKRETYLPHNPRESVWKSINYCEKEELIHLVSKRKKIVIRKPEKLPEAFSYVPYEKIKFSNGSKFTYYPIIVEGYKEAIPFMICNNAYGKKGLYNLGIYNGREFFPVTDTNLLIRGSNKLTEILESEVKPVLFQNVKGTLKHTFL